MIFRQQQRAGLSGAIIGPASLTLLVIFISIPIALTIWLSFREPTGQDVSMAAWLTILSSDEAGYALGYSFLMGASIAVSSVVCGFPLAFLMGVRGGYLGRSLIALMLVLWLIDPGIRILGWMQIVRSSIGFGIVPDSVQGSFISEFAAGVHAWLPVSAVLLAMAFANVPSNQLAAARECGATPLALFRYILWPQCRHWAALTASVIFCGASGSFLEPRLLGSGLFEQATEWLQRAMESEIGWPYASAMLTLLLTFALLPVVLSLYRRASR